MQVISRLKDIRISLPGVVSMGAFDGVHLAHRRILSAAVKKARLIKGRSVAVTFWPHPQNKETLYSLQHRLNLIAGLGIDTCVIIRFSRAFSRMSAEKFVADILVKKLKARYIYVGEDFRFGYRAKGDAKLLSRLSKLYGFKLKLYKTMKLGGERISSTYIRSLISRGELKKAGLFLAHPVSVLGKVIKGDSIARGLGFPTANIDPHHEVTPAAGVYAVKAILNDKKLDAICYIGRRPTVIDPARRLSHRKNIEVFIFRFNKNIYGKNIQIEFVKKIREEKKFSSLKDLVRQIKKDTLQSKKILSLH